jgi:hypothetical protein
MSLDELNRNVTAAVLRAEALPPGSWDAQRAFREVADLEEEIATIVGANTVEGEIARLSAIAAALSAGEPLRAIQLGTWYSPDGLSEPARRKLEALLREADEEILRAVGDAPSVEPIRFSLRDA